MKAECLNCAKLAKCTETDAEKVLGNYFCDNWEASTEEVLQARMQVINDFGNQGLDSILSTDNKP